MIPHLRKAFNDAFSNEIYQTFLQDLENTHNKEVVFRVAETPLFVPNELRDKLIEASEDIIDTLLKPEFMDYSAKAIPANFNVPNETAVPDFICIDFAICKDENGALIPQLIELQGCASLYCFQHFVAQKYRQHFQIPPHFSHLFGNRNSDEFLDFLRDVILKQHDPKNVVLLEIKPHEQKTRIDFYCTQAMLGVKPVCISEVWKENNQLFYDNNGTKTQIKRLYNRIIAEDFQRYPDLVPGFDMTENVDVEWAGHPNWFFRISKYTLPLLKNPYVPESTLLSDFDVFPNDLENYVLKPLFSFAGTGVNINVTPQDLQNIEPENRADYILQKKVQYDPVIQSPNNPVKVELRMMYLWKQNEPRPQLLTNLGRMSKGEMIGVRFNQNNDWVGGTVGFFDVGY